MINRGSAHGEYMGMDSLFAHPLLAVKLTHHYCLRFKMTTATTTTTNKGRHVTLKYFSILIKIN